MKAKWKSFGGSPKTMWQYVLPGGTVVIEISKWDGKWCYGGYRYSRISEAKKVALNDFNNRHKKV
jgi:hypothetical protein